MSRDDDSDSLARLSTEHFRIGMRFRVIALGLIALTHVVLGVSGVHTGAFGGAGPDEARRFLVPNVGTHLLVIALNVWALSRNRGTRTYATVARISLLGEAFTAATGLWLQGSLEAGPSIVFTAILIPVYRLYYGRELGLWALITVLALHGGLVTLDELGVTGSGWGNPGYEPPRTTAEALISLGQWNLFYLIAWVASAASARRSETIRVLRRQLQSALDRRNRFGPLSATLLDGRYEIGALLGRGGMGDVYRARDTGSGEEVAIKVLHPLFAENEPIAQRFRLEADTIAKLGVPGVPRVRRVAMQRSGHSFIVMEFLDGESLAQVIDKEGPMDLARLSVIVGQMAAILDKVHDAGIVHRDLKPSNVLVVSTGRADATYVLDFGVAKLREGLPAPTQTGMLLGTAGYIAPECVRHGSAEATRAADVFAMAAVAYEALTGEPAFSARELATYCHDVLNRDPTPAGRFVPSLASQVERVLARGMARDPNERFSRASEFAAALSAATVDTNARSELKTPVLQAGNVIADRYRLERCLGRGGMGTVWAATHTVTERTVAMKFLERTNAEPQLRSRFLREARAASRLKHPNVVEIVDVFDVAEHSPAIVMELLHGETLADKLQRDGALDLADAARLLVPLISAIGSAHALGVVHRDLKPSNVFLAGSASGVCVKVLDFGLAQVAGEDPLTQAGDMLGTPGYMAPEQAQSTGVDHRVDVWAIGVIAYECLTGVRPIEGMNSRQRVERLLTDAIVPIEQMVPDLPGEISACVTGMLARDPARRPGDLREVGTLLARYVGDVAIRA